MDQLDLARIQFATTSIYHFFFVPVTMGLGDPGGGAAYPMAPVGRSGTAPADPVLRDR